MKTLIVYTIYLWNIESRNSLMEFIKQYTNYILYETSEISCTYKLQTVKERSLLNMYKRIKLFCSIIGIYLVKVVKEIRNKEPNYNSESD